MNRMRPLISAVLIYLLTIGLAGDFKAAAQSCHPWDSPSDRSTVLQLGNVDNCGDTNWELEASYGYLWDEGEYDATGTCTGGYINCNCGNVAVSFKPATKVFEFTHVDEYDSTWWWVITNYELPSYNACTSGTCQSTGYKSQNFPTYIDENAGYDYDETCLI